jgi:CHAT domain-containing protein/Flp pilus assembly protein TadD
MLPARRILPGLAIALATWLAAPSLPAQQDESPAAPADEQLDPPAEAPPSIETLLAERRYEEARTSLVSLSGEWYRALKANPTPEANLDWARVLLSLGMVEDRLAEYDSSIRHLEKSLELLSDHGGAASLRGDCLDALGLATGHAGKFDEAEKWFTRAIELRLAAPEAEREPWLSASRDHLGLTYLTAGRYEDAGRLFHEGLAGTPTDKPALLAQRHGYLGRYYHTLHSHARALEHLEQAVAHAETAWGRNDPNTLTLLGQLGVTTLRLGDQDRARAILEEVTTLAREHADDTTGSLRLAGFLNNLGSLALLEDDPAKAQRLFLESLRSLEQRLGANHLALGPIWNNLGCAFQENGSFEKADQCFEKSGRIYLDAMGPDHQRSVEALANRALNTLLSGDAEQAGAQIAAASTAAERVLNRLIRFGSERQRLNYLRSVDTLSLACSAGLDPELISNTLLATKGRLLDVLLAEDAGATSPVLAKLRATQAQLDHHLLSGDAPAARLDKLRSELRTLERQAGSSAPSAGDEPVTWEMVQASLPPQSAFVDFVRYLDYTATPDWVPRYGAILILPEDPPQWIPLGSEEALQTWLEVLARRLSYRAAKRQGLEEAAAPVLKLKPGLRQLHEQFWEPVAARLPDGTHSLCLCPDASLNFLSFAVLLDGENRFLASRHELCAYVSSGRDLLVPPRDAGLSAAPWSVFAVDSFAAPAASEPLTAFQQQLSEAIVDLAPLAGARRESAILQPFLPEGSRVLTGADATEAALRATSSPPAVLHLITHGFFLGDPTHSGSDRRLQDLDDNPLPLYRSGLILHGAKSSLAGSTSGDPGSDDILFASDVATLPLEGTELVTLSSCQSALGQPLAGEGILGLRRGFALAGARNLLLTLWPVTDDATPEFMQRFHTIAAETKHLSQAAWQTQREGLAPIDPNDAAALEEAVLTLGPFVLCQRQGLMPPRAVTPPPPPPQPDKIWLIVSASFGSLAILFLLATWRRKLT